MRSLLDPWLGNTLPYITYFAAIVAAAWFGRLGPSLFAVVLSCIAADWFFIPPRYSLKLSYDECRRIGLVWPPSSSSEPSSPLLVNRSIEPDSWLWRDGNGCMSLSRASAML